MDMRDSGSGMRCVALCAGIGGIELGVPATTVAVAETDQFAGTVLDNRMPPDVARLGDWTTLESIDGLSPDLLTAGLPCQPVSTAGDKQGEADDRWMFDHLTALLKRGASRPVIFLENVAAIQTPAFSTEMQRWRDGMSRLGYSVREAVIAAADVGACHRRRRWFSLALPDGLSPIDLPAAPGIVDTDDLLYALRPLLPTPLSNMHKGLGYLDGDLTRRLLIPTPRVTGAGPDRRSDRTSSGGPNLHGVLIGRDLIPTPMAGSQAGRARSDRSETRNLHQMMAWNGERVAPESTGEQEPDVSLFDLLEDDSDWETIEMRPDGRVFPGGWGRYQLAIDVHQIAFGRDAPVQVKMPDLQLVTPEFVEWMMGMEPGWVTEAIPHRPALRCLGNAVVPQQASAAWNRLLRAHSMPAGLATSLLAAA